MTEAEMPIDMAKTTLGGALKNGPLRVPKFQREYSWTKERVRKLFDDLHNAMVVKRQSYYFLGTVVLTPGRPPCIIDGQQRLATATIFLAAIRDAMLDLEKEKNAKSVEKFLFAFDRNLGEDGPALTLNVDDCQYMRHRVLDRPADRTGEPAKRFHSHRLIDQAARIAKERVGLIMANADKPARKVEALDQWVEFIEHSAVIVMLTPPNAARAFQMYKTLNDRVQRATQADMIKNHLFEHADSRSDEAQAKWSGMRSIIEGISRAGDDDPLLTYLHHASIVRYGPIQLEDIFDRMEEKVVGQADSLRFLDDLATYADDYAAIVTPTHPKWGTGYDQAVKKCVSDIAQEIRMSFIRPLMLAVATHLKPSEVLKSYRNIRSWVVRFLVAGGSRSGVVEKAIGDAAVKIRDGAITKSKELTAALVEIVPNNLKFQGAFSTKAMSSSRQVRFLLRELEAQLRFGQADAILQASPDVDDLTLEHILPKNLAAKKGWEYYSDEERKAFRLRIGNTVLVDTKGNGAVNDEPFTKKRPLIEKSKFLKLNEDVLIRTADDPVKWTALQIAARQKWLAEIAIKRWPLRSPGKE